MQIVSTEQDLYSVLHNNAYESVRLKWIETWECIHDGVPDFLYFEASPFYIKLHFERSNRKNIFIKNRLAELKGHKWMLLAHRP